MSQERVSVSSREKLKSIIKYAKAELAAGITFATVIPTWLIALHENPEQKTNDLLLGLSGLSFAVGLGLIMEATETLFRVSAISLRNENQATSSPGR